jgi:hypothetical protein
MERARIGSRNARALLATVAVAVALLIPSATTLAGADAIPLSGTFHGNLTVTPCAPLTVCAEGSLEGVARHLGRTTMDKSVIVHFTLTPCPGGSGSTFSETITLIAANGDFIELTGTGEACAGGGVSTGSATLTVTGGTGRFENVTGSLSETFVHDLISGLETSVLTGAISAPGH